MKDEEKIYVLSVAGSDSSAGAGVQADLKTIMALGGYCVVSITSITAQNKNKVSKIYTLDSSLVVEQIKTVLQDFNIKGIKIGLITNHNLSKKISAYIQGLNIPIVVDPVFVSTSGFKFISENNYKKSQIALSNCANLLTPNIREAEILSKIKINNNPKNIEESLLLIYQKMKTPILIKGTHFENDQIVDTLFDGSKFKRFMHKKIDIEDLHGTGCTLSSAICFYLAQGLNLEKSIKKARGYILSILKKSSVLKPKGYLNH